MKIEEKLKEIRRENKEEERKMKEVRDEKNTRDVNKVEEA